VQSLSEDSPSGPTPYEEPVMEKGGVSGCESKGEEEIPRILSSRGLLGYGYGDGN